MKQYVQKMVIHTFFLVDVCTMNKNSFNLSAKLMKWVIKQQQEELKAEKMKNKKNAKKIQKMEKNLRESRGILALAGVVMMGKSLRRRTIPEIK